MAAPTWLIFFSFLAWGGLLQHEQLQRKLDALARGGEGVSVCAFKILRAHRAYVETNASPCKA